MARQRGVVGRASRGVLREIDERIKELDSELATYKALVTERERLLAARASVTGERRTQRISQDELVAYLQEHPGQRAGEIAEALGVPLATISSHLYRGKDSRFENRPNGWHAIQGHGGPQRSRKE